MASNQYNYAPPPPPPSAQSGPPTGFNQYHQGPYPPRGGGRGRGRGHYQAGGRGDFHASSSFNHHAVGYNSSPQVNSGFNQQNTGYMGPHSQGPPNNYPPQQQWHEQHQHHQPHVQVHHGPSPSPVPLSAQNYHPNYAPQVYQQPQPPQHGPPQTNQQYGPQQPPFQHNQQAPYVQHGQGPPGPPHNQWQGPPHHAQPPYNGGGRGRGRGGGGPGRGGYDTPMMGPPIRMGFNGDRPENSMPQASNGYAQPYSNSHQTSPVPYVQDYSSSPQNFVQRGQRHALDPNPYHANGYRGGRGGMQNYRGKRDASFSSVDKSRFKNGKHRSSDGSFSQSFTDASQKPADDEAKSGDKKKKKKKRKTNTLGLTPANEDYQDSEEEEDDADEESRLAANVADTSTPSLPSDLAAWLKERRERWPTKARREANEAELAKRRQLAAEQSQRDRAKARKEKEEREDRDKSSKSGKAVPGETRLERQQRKADKLRLKLEKAEQALQDAKLAGTKRKRESGDTGDDDCGDALSKTEGDEVDQVIAKATAGIVDYDTESSTEDSSEYTDDSDSDGSPATMTSRRTAPIRVLPPPKKAILERQCKYFSTGGTCGKKGKCRFVHDQAVRDAALREKEMNGGRMTLSQRLMQNEREKEELVVVKSIKYLFQHGYLDEAEPSGDFYDEAMPDEYHQPVEEVVEEEEEEPQEVETYDMELQGDDYMDNEV